MFQMSQNSDGDRDPAEGAGAGGRERDQDGRADSYWQTCDYNQIRQIRFKWTTWTYIQRRSAKSRFEQSKVFPKGTRSPGVTYPLWISWWLVPMRRKERTRSRIGANLNVSAVSLFLVKSTSWSWRTSTILALFLYLIGQKGLKWPGTKIFWRMPLKHTAS